MNIGDRVKVVRIDDYTRQCCEADGTPTGIGMVGIVEEVRYNPNMHRTEVIALMEGDLYIWEPWNLSVIKEPGP